MTSRLKLFVPIVLIIGALLAPQLAYAQDPEAKKNFDRGRFEYQDGNYEDALSFVDNALKLEPGNAEYLHLKGVILSRLKRYDEAIQLLDKAISTDPIGQKAANIELAHAYAAKKDDQNAIKYYDKSITIFPRRADLFLSRGIARLNKKQYNEAETDFMQAAKVDPKLSAVAYYHMALASYQKEDYKTTKAQLNKAISMNPDPGLLKNCQTFLANIQREEKAHKPFSATAAFLLQYDDNVISDPLNEALSAGTDQADISYGFNFAATFKPISTRSRELGVTYSFLSNFYQDLKEYDSLQHTIGLYYMLHKKPLLYRIQGEYSYYYVDNEDRMSLTGITPSVLWSITPDTRFEVKLGVEFRKMLDDTSDAYHYILKETIYHDIHLSQGKILGLNAALKSELDNPLMDSGFKYESHELLFGLTLPAFYGVITNLGASVGQVNYAQHEYYGSERRHDEKFGLNLRVSRFIGNNVQVMFMWTYDSNDSNVSQDGDDDLDPYEYKRNLYALVITAYF